MYESIYNAPLLQPKQSRVSNDDIGIGEEHAGDGGDVSYRMIVLWPY